MQEIYLQGENLIGDLVGTFQHFAIDTDSQRPIPDGVFLCEGRLSRVQRCTM